MMGMAQLIKDNLENLLDQKGKVGSYQSVRLAKIHPFHFQYFQHCLTDNSHPGQGRNHQIGIGQAKFLLTINN